jgi:hypothetical protein
VVRIARVALGLLDAAALVDAGRFAPALGNYFSYFTIESNILACLVLLVGGLRDPDTDLWVRLRVAATVYITITGIVYALVLSGSEVGLISEWTNTVLHRLTPLGLVLDLALCGPWRRISPGSALRWLAAPLAFLAYSLVRGPIVDWYPYPFLDPRRPGGYPRVAVNCALLALGMAALALAISRLAGWRARGRSAAGDAA